MDEQLKQILTECSISTRMVAKTFFPERFTMPFAENVHGEIFKRIDSGSNKVAIAAPGWGKTSIVALALIARWILFNLTGLIHNLNSIISLNLYITISSYTRDQEYRLYFDTGTGSAPAVGSSVTGATSGITVDHSIAVVTSGTWAGGAAGYLRVKG